MWSALNPATPAAQQSGFKFRKIASSTMSPCTRVVCPTLNAKAATALSGKRACCNYFATSATVIAPGRMAPVAIAAAKGCGSNDGTAASAPAAHGTTAHDGSYNFDVFVIGGGSGGVRTARVASEKGCRVALVELPLQFIASTEKGGLGGTCVLRGCVPKKLMLYATQFAPEMEAAKGFGWTHGALGELDWSEFIKAKREELLRLNKAYVNNLNKAAVHIMEGQGEVLGPHEVQVDGKKFTARNIVIATGGQASKPPIPGAEHAIVSDKVLELDSIPRVVTLIGGGYIGMEFAGMFARLGCEVHVVARQELPLAPRFDKEVCQFFKQQCTEAAGIHLHMCSNPTEIVKEADGTLTVKLDPVNKGNDNGGTAGSSSEIRGNQQVVLATGRAAKTKGLGLEQAGVELGAKGSLKVDKYSRTNVPSIWGVGDVTSRNALTPVAIMEGNALANTLCGGKVEAPDYDAVPSACFSWPYVATVGLTEEQATSKGLAFEVYSHTFAPLKAHLAARGTPNKPLQKGFMKLLCEPNGGKLLGLHVVGEEAPEIIQGYALALKLGATKHQLDSLVGIHPTAAEEVLGLKGPTRTVQAKSEGPRGKEEHFQVSKDHKAGTAGHTA